MPGGEAELSGPVIFRQTRYGMDGKPIMVWKFRSMKVMENDKVVTQATQNDPRVTRVGNFLRRTSLDELPQFINVFTGGMSIVGPRPHAVAHNEQYRSLIEGYMLRHKVKPALPAGRKSTAGAVKPTRWKKWKNALNSTLSTSVSGASGSISKLFSDHLQRFREQSGVLR